MKYMLIKTNKEEKIVMRRIIKLNKECTFEAAHFIPNHIKCGVLHGHSYRVGISIVGSFNSKDGMFVDFGEIKKIICKFDHVNLNKYFKFPSAENLAIYFALKIARLNRNIFSVTVTVFETESACATFTYTNPIFV